MLGTFFSIGFLAGAIEFLLALGISPVMRNVNGPAFALTVVILSIVGMAMLAQRFKVHFFAVGLSVGFIGLLVGMYLSRLLFFAFT
jgi:hypothetical protein